MAIDLLKFNFDNPANGLDQEQLKSIENELQAPLDENYRAFLGTIDGGRPVPPLVSDRIDLTFPILIFLGNGSLVSDFKSLAGTLGSKDYLPIAYDSAWRRICLKVGFHQSPVCVVSIDDLYYREPTRVTEVFGSFATFWDSLSQPAKMPSSYFESLAERPWNVIQSQIELNPEYLMSPQSDELSLLCQVIRAENEEAFYGLLSAGASLDEALRIAVTCERFDFVKKLVDSGAFASDGIPFAVGPSRKEMRDYLKSCSR